MKQPGSSGSPAHDMAQGLGAVAERERETRVSTALRKRALYLDGFPGALVPSAGNTPPAGWLRCDGQVVLRADYADLFAAIGTAYNTGGESGTQFRLPPLNNQNRFPRGNATAGGTGGSHATSTPISLNTGGPSALVDVAGPGAIGVPSQSATYNVTGTGTGTADDPPYVNVVWFVKT